jgi:hypothetical protein
MELGKPHRAGQVMSSDSADRAKWGISKLRTPPHTTVQSSSSHHITE